MSRNLQRNQRGGKKPVPTPIRRPVPPTVKGGVSGQKAPTTLTVDFLDETPMDKREAYGCVMFASPGETMMENFKKEVSIETGVSIDIVEKILAALDKRVKPKLAFKYVGGRATVEECEVRIKEIEDDEPMFHIWTVQNGYWLTFDPNPELIQDENYRNEQLNELMKKNKKLNEQKTKDFFRQEMRKRVERARLEGTKEGQEILLQQEEAIEAVENRVQSTADGIKEFQEKIVELETSRKLAEQKLEMMRQKGITTNDANASLDQKISELSKPDAANEEKREITRQRLKEAQAIEEARVKRGDAPAPPAVNSVDHSMFESDPLIPSSESK